MLFVPPYVSLKKQELRDYFWDFNIRHQTRKKKLFLSIQLLNGKTYF